MKLLRPQELRKYAFNHAIRGYSTAEVDEYIEFLCGKYEEVYREHDELERKLIAALRALDQLKNRESRITELDSQAKRASARMLAEAEAQKKRIIADAEEYADRIIADADAHVAQKEELLERMRRSVLAFRDELYSRYNEQIDHIEALTALAQSDDPLPPEEESTDGPLGAAASAGELTEVFSAEETEEPAAEAETEEDDDALEAEISETDAALMFYDESEEEAAEVIEAGDEDGAEDEPIVPAAAAEEQFFALFESSADADGGDTADEEDVPEEDDEPGEEPDDGELMKFLEEFTARGDGESDAEEEDEADEEKAVESDADEAEEPAKEDDDDALLRELRQTFGINFETFTAGAEKKSDYDFVSDEDSEESVDLTPRRRAKKMKEEKDNRR